MPAITASFSGSVYIRGLYEEVLNFVIGYVDPSSEFVYPTLTYTANQNAIIPSGIPISSPGSTLVTLTTFQGRLFSASWMTVVQEGGAVILRKRGRIEATGGITVQYKVYIGRFV
jgi:hypothetical protein